MSTVAADVRAHLVAQAIVDGGTGWTSVLRRVHDEATKLVVVTEDGGRSPELPASSGVGEAAARDLGVQVRVLGPKWDGDATEVKAQEIFDALHGLLSTVLGAQLYLRVRALSEPTFLGYDETGRPDITASYRLYRFIN